MAHAIWNGAITFGLVTIPVKLFPAVREAEGIHLHFLHGKDKGRIKNVRKCENDGHEVPWKEIVRGFEYAKGEYLVVTDEELDKLRPARTQAVEIQQFVDLAEIEPMLFDRPYYLEPGKTGRHAYVLLRAALEQSGKVGIALVVLRSRQYLAALKPNGDALVLQTMHFATEIIPRSALDLPAGKEKAGDKEMKSALMLVDAMAKPFDPSAYEDTFHDELRELLARRARGAPPPAQPRAARATNVVDLVAVLKRSLANRGARGKEGTKARSAKPHAKPGRAKVPAPARRPASRMRA